MASDASRPLGNVTPQPPEGPNVKFRPDVGAGVSGLNTYGDGRIYEEWLPELVGPRGRRVYREMADNDPIIGAILFSIEMLMRQVDWDVQPHDDSPAAKELADFVDSALHDMEFTWEDTLASILSFLQFGWSLHEVVYKRRNGRMGKETDGKVGWKGWYIRGQESLDHWLFDPDDWSPKAMVQLGPPDWRFHTIPLTKSLLFRTTVQKNNPEGRSLLRNAYRPWYFKKHVETFEAIGIERDLAGVPFAGVPAEVLLQQTPNDVAMYNAIKEIVTQVKRDENEGIIWPLSYNDQGKPEYEFKLLTSGGTRQFDTSAIIDRKSQEITMVVMADFIMLGHQQRGSNAMAKTKSKLFTTALLALLDTISAQINDKGIPDLLRINGYQTDLCPKIVHGDIERNELDLLGTFIFNLSQSGAQLDLTQGSELLNFLLRQAGLPETDADEVSAAYQAQLDLAAAAAKAKAQPPTIVQQAPGQPGAQPAQPAPKQPGKPKARVEHPDDLEDHPEE